MSRDFLRNLLIICLKVIMSHKLILTTLPHYREGNLLKFSVAVSFRLEPSQESSLKSFPSLLEWANKVQNTGFNFRFGNFKSSAMPLNSIDANLWQDLFYEDIRVQRMEMPDLSKSRLNSYQVKNLSEFVQRKYTQFAVSNPVPITNSSSRLLQLSKFTEVMR